MKKLIALVAAGFLLTAPALSATLTSNVPLMVLTADATCSQTVEEFVAYTETVPLKTPIELVRVEGEALVKFMAAINKIRTDAGAPPMEADLVMWAKLAHLNGPEMIGIAFFNKGCIVIANQVSPEWFADFMAKIYGPDAVKNGA